VLLCIIHTNLKYLIDFYRVYLLFPSVCEMTSEVLKVYAREEGRNWSNVALLKVEASESHYLERPHLGFKSAHAVLTFQGALPKLKTNKKGNYNQIFLLATYCSHLESLVLSAHSSQVWGH
jgi:hypothetical protein